MIVENKHREMAKQYTKRHCKTREDKDALQEIVHRAQLTTEGPCQGLQGEQEFDVQEPALFLRGRLYGGLYCGHKGKGYATEVVTTGKLPPDDLEGVKDNSGEAQSQQDNDKETKGRRQSQEGS